MPKIFEQQKYYFRDYPKTPYQFVDGTEKDILDFLHRWAFVNNIKNNGSAFSEWIIRDQDTMYSISEKLYGSQMHFWIILMMNDIIDPVFGWPLNETYFNEFVKKKYGSEAIYSLHHYESGASEDLLALPEGIEVSADYFYNKVEISNFEYESRINEDKRRIKLLKPEYLGQVLQERDDILREGFKGYTGK